MPQPPRATLRTTVAVALAAALPLALVAALNAVPADATDVTAPTFRRINVDTSVTGASFSTVGQVYADEQDIVTSGYGLLDDNGRPVGGGTLQLYRPGATLSSWTKVTVFGADEGIVFPNATTIDDVDGDGDADLIVPSGYFFGTESTAPDRLHATGAITWWENRGAGTAFVKHVVVEGQAGSYHGVQHVDLDGDGTRDLLSVSEEARTPGDVMDDTVTTQFFRGLGDGTFAAPVTLASDLGGSQPVTYDVDGDDDLDIVSSQYFHLMNNAPGAASFLWLENVDADGTLTSSDFTPHTIATILDTGTDRGVGMGFQIRPVPGFRGPGTVAWIGTNHVNRCTIPAPFSAIPEQVIEFVPNADLSDQWELNTLSDTPTPPPACPSDYSSGDYLTHSEQITARWGYGQGAPGVFGYGDIDGDGDVDLLVSGDGDRRLWWVENQGAGETTLHQLTKPGEYFGQAGGAAVVDLNGNGANELVFSSFDQNAVAVWTRDSTTSPSSSPSTGTPTTSATPTPTPADPAPRTVRSSLDVTPAKRATQAGRKTTWKIRLQAAPGGARRTVTVIFDRAKGKDVLIGRVTLRRTSNDAVQRGQVTYRPRTSGRVVVRYAGTTVSPTLRDTRATDAARITVRR